MSKKKQNKTKECINPNIRESIFFIYVFMSNQHIYFLHVFSIYFMFKLIYEVL